MRKNLIAVLLVLVMLVSLLPVAALAEDYPIADDMAEMLKLRLAVSIDKAMRLSKLAIADDPYAIDDLMIKDPTKFVKIPLADVLGDQYAIADDIAEMMKQMFRVPVDGYAIDDLMIKDPAQRFKIKLTDVLGDPYAIADDVAEMLKAGILVVGGDYAIDDMMIKDPSQLMKVPVDGYAIDDLMFKDPAQLIKVADVPADTITRAMLWQVLAELQGVDTDGGASWYAKAKTWAVENGISDGYNSNGSLSREQLITMLYNCMGKPATKGDISAFADAAAVSAWAKDAMRWAVENGILLGAKGKLNPQADATRTELEAVLMRFCVNLLK